MKLRIRYEVNDGEKLRKFSRTFTNLDDKLTNEDLSNFAKAFVALSEVENHIVEKVTEERI
ncbi:hypothetical protein [Anaerococcus hydrogenalis]|uniref:DUF1659 domain-containing protein n=3 Tax=Anaerococcus hydrogenalis TaxID=33029 RepID=F0H138_9FIRM|nr:hypothetical protein [Anaerococcus hydrogenalis]EEB36855.1 hypothetical protein ANHYDRO_00249 [Anaerococcus hydrogenalis DSM 7454]EGC83818.1 hypothetical protein HMPREF9246_1918 [Anaerococcus hydrogenalis ACS-025-V-Sch4]MBS5989246.1 hypothetical protein [Anaerococcus hydrogenalis]MDK7695462.1 hypothetical protein [Anaerococcus hydrogenalis]MDK7697308.1 hypothetical protein [Anaerococcus hydrogenalis]